MTTWLMGLSVTLLLCLGGALWRVWRGPAAADRLMAVQLVCTSGAGVILLLTAATGWAALDLALTLVLLAPFATVGFVIWARAGALEDDA